MFYFLFMFFNEIKSIKLKYLIIYIIYINNYVYMLNKKGVCSFIIN